MPVLISLLCGGPSGSNGCPDAAALPPTECEENHRAIKDEWGRLATLAETRKWVRSPSDRALRCPECATAPPGTIAGFPRATWDRAMDLFVSGVPICEWSGRDGLPTARQWANAINKHPDLRERAMESPLSQHGRDRADVLPDERWSEALARFNAGEDKAAICTGRDGWPTAKQWNGRMERNPDFRSAVLAEWDARAQARHAATDAALTAFEGGAILAEVFDGSTRNAWWVRLQSDPDFRARVRAEHERRQKFIQYARNERSAADLEAAARANQARQVKALATLAHIAAGGKVTDLPGPPHTYSPSGHSSLVGSDPEYAAAYDAALTENGRGRHGAGLRVPYRPDLTLSWDAALEAVTDSSAGLEVVLSGVARAPTPGQWNRRRERDSTFGALAQDAVRSARRLRHKEKTDRAILRAHRLGEARQAARERRQEDPALHLNTRLAQNDLYRSANRAVSAGIPQAIRDDVIADIVLAVLEGELDAADISTRARSFVASYHRAARTYQTVSADQVIPGTDNLRIIDRLTNEDRI